MNELDQIQASMNGNLICACGDLKSSTRDRSCWVRPAQFKGKDGHPRTDLRVNSSFRNDSLSFLAHLFLTLNDGKFEILIVLFSAV